MKKVGFLHREKLNPSFFLLMKTTKYPVESSVITNNFRIYYMELYNKIPFFNITAFAKICGLPFMSASRYLNDGVVPRYPRVLDRVEERLGKPRGDFFVERDMVEWNEQEVTWAHPPRPDARKKYAQAEPNREWLVEEDEVEFCKPLTRKEANCLYSSSLMRAYIEMIAEGQTNYDECIVELITTPRL